ncbi:hypothetical protein CY35_06G030400 [Sphagnum magellanicum]|nr:hypothetical protein CY35_06G030400 [Sphagnum magellanicum]
MEPILTGGSGGKAATAVDKVFRKVLSSLLLENPWHGERRSTCKATYCTYFYI